MDKLFSHCWEFHFARGAKLLITLFMIQRGSITSSSVLWMATKSSCESTLKNQNSLFQNCWSGELILTFLPTLTQTCEMFQSTRIYVCWKKSFDWKMKPICRDDTPLCCCRDHTTLTLARATTDTSPKVIRGGGHAGVTGPPGFLKPPLAKTPSSEEAVALTMCRCNAERDEAAGWLAEG